MSELYPVLPLLAGALLGALTRGWPRALIMLAAPLAGALMLWHFDPEQPLKTEVLGLTLTLVRLDSLALLFGYLFHLAAFLGVVYALHLRDRLQDMAALAYAASAVGAVLAGDLLTLFLFWELLTITSAGLVLARRTRRALHSALRYLLVQVGSGVLLLAGVLAYAQASRGLAFDAIGLDAPGGGLIFLAFGIKSAFPLFHNWLTDAYPEATPTGTVFLNAFTTKVAIYCLARGFTGTEMLIYIGAVMACFPVFFAVIENDLRRVLAYSLVNQLGFMVVGIGVGTELALNGALAHAFNDVLFKGLLFMSMGAVLHVTGEARASELGGLYRRMPRTAVFCLVGAASISALPLLNGFIGKSMVMSATLAGGYPGVWLALLFAAAGALLYVGIKVPFFAFFSGDSSLTDHAREPPLNMQVAMALTAGLCLLMGSAPQLLYALLPYPVDYPLFKAGHVLSQLQLLAFAALAFVWLKLSGLYPPPLRSINLDVDWSYREGLLHAAAWIRARWVPRDRWLRRRGQALVAWVLRWLHRHHGIQGILARSWPIGSMMLWVSLLLGTSLLLYYR